MDVNAKQLIVVGGPNGAGKTTFAEKYSSLHGVLYLGADKIASELSPSDPMAARVEASTEFLRRFEEAISRDVDVVIESTLSGKTLQHRMRMARDKGYRVYTVFVFLESADACVDRVLERNEKGGHHVPESDVRRRFPRSLSNFWNIYRDLSDQWVIVNNSGRVPVDVALGTTDTISIRDTDQFNLFHELLDDHSDG